ncbi:hypothetical protein [Amycolatopsis benzoatilytica]|uniref:hypothetical protein n=1 Tax=Amycolatopsis benzoatilytica TaxID=346045 RepID=UPI00037ACE50|nr:hypothetical protein [Amycolatopsis benzoatilytica]
MTSSVQLNRQICGDLLAGEMITLPLALLIRSGHGIRVSVVAMSDPLLGYVSPGNVFSLESQRDRCSWTP